MFNLVNLKKEKGPLVGRKRRRNRANLEAAVVAPLKRANEVRRIRNALNFLGRGLLFGVKLLEKPELIRLRGPGLRPEERFEFEELNAREGARRLGWY